MSDERSDEYISWADLLIHHRLYRHGAVHQPDAGVGGVAVTNSKESYGRHHERRLPFPHEHQP